jgi:hypothetical protein
VQHIRGIEIQTKLKIIGDYNILIFAILQLSYICIMKYYNRIKNMLKMLTFFLACDVY